MAQVRTVSPAPPSAWASASARHLAEFGARLLLLHSSVRDEVVKDFTCKPSSR
jgi:hypothetical protein